jgi:hypothetical protein
MMRVVFLICGVLALALGLIGIVVPFLPSTPFLILAAACFARSSRRFHDWLVGHPTFGPVIRDWRDQGAIAPRAKRAAAVAMALTLVISALIGLPWAVLAVQGVVLAGMAAFVLSRPSPR